jgi:hypothetical protein
MADQLKTLVYTVKMNVDGAVKGAKTMSITMLGMGDAADGTNSDMDRLAKTMTDKYGVSVKAVVDNTKSAQAEMKRLNRESIRSEKAFRAVSNQYKQLAQGAKLGSEEIEILNAQMRLGANATDAQKNKVRELVTAFQLQRKEMTKTQGSMRGLRGQMSNVGFQLQDIAVQAQMGTAAFVILGQQGSQLAGGFGPKGALIGAGIAIGAMLLNVLVPALVDSGKRVEELAGKFEKLKESIGLTEAQAAFLADTQQENIDNSLKEIKAIDKRIESQKKELKEAKKLQKADQTTIENGGKKSVAYKRAASDLEKNTRAVEKVEKELRLETAARESQLNVIKDAGIALQSYNLAIGDTGTDKLNDWTESNKKLVDSLRDQVDAAGKSKSQLLETERALKLKLAVEQKARVEQVLYIANGYEILILAERELEAIQDKAKETAKQDKADAKAAKKKAVANKELADLLKEYESQINEVAAIEERLGTDKLTRLAMQYTAERSMLKKHGKDLTALDEEYEKNKRRIQATGIERYMIAVEDQLQTFDEVVEASLTNFTKSFGQAFSGAILESDNIGDGIKDLFIGATKSLVAFFGEWAAQELILWTLRKVLDKTTAAPAAAAMTLNAQSTSLQAGLAAFASTAAIPIVGPALAPAAMGAALSITQPFAAAIGGLSAGFAGLYDKGGVIPQDMFGIVSEYGNELVNGVMVKGGQGGSRVTSREETANMMNGGKGGDNFYITGGDNASAEQITRAMIRKLKSRGGKDLDTALYESGQRGRRNKGKR